MLAEMIGNKRPRLTTNAFMNKLTKLAIIIASSIAATISARANTVTVQEVGVSPTETVSITMNGFSGTYDTVGTWNVYAGVTQLLVNNVATNSFCIDPFQWSSSGAALYTVTDLGSAPNPFAMGSAKALIVEELWAAYYAKALTDPTTAAGLQIAIWETVAPMDFKLNGTNDYGASTFLASLQAGGINAGIAPANLVALSSGKNQDYVVQYVPDAGMTLVLLGLGLVAMTVVGRKTRSVSTTN